ncbi:MAG: sodium:solute symporter family protein [Luteolibacter sp.]
MIDTCMQTLLASVAGGGGALSEGSAIKINLNFVDFSILGIYLAFVIGIGFALKKYATSAEDFLLSGRSIPGWITGLAFISANLGAQELIGMAASGAEYGIMTSHYYWVGAIPAMVFLGIFMMPMYYGSKAKSVPEYLKMRYDEKTRVFNSFSFAFMTIASSGISMHALAQLLHFLLGWDYNLCLLCTSFVVLAYVLKGGLSSAIYTEVLQFFMIVLGIAPLAYLGLKNVGGWEGLTAKLGQSHMHSWAETGTLDNPMGVPWYGILFGLGFVLSFGYWCTNFAEVQRALAANSMGAARRTPIIGAVPKMLFPAIVILPGMVGLALTQNPTEGGYSIPVGDDGRHVFNLVLPSMINHYFPNGMLGLAMTALMASFMSGMAANVTAFNTVWTYDIYQGLSKQKKTDKQLLRMGKFATIGGILLSIGFAYFAKSSNNIMTILQTVFGFVNAPLFATFLLGMFTKRSNSNGAFWGLVTGTLAALVFQGISLAKGNIAGFAKGGWISPVLEFPKEMSQAFWIALVAFSVTFIVNAVLSLATRREKSEDELRGLVYSLTPKYHEEGGSWFGRPAVCGSLVLLAAIILNFIFW